VASQAVQTATIGLAAAQAAVEAARARVPAAEAALELARRDLSLTEVHAPAAGVASKVDLQPGELVQRGQSVLAIVPDARYVVANFKETDLDHVAVGRPVSIEVDAFPDRPMHGRIESIGAGTGAVYSLLPADNATGNFVKVVQRVPVRISFDETDLTGVAAGLSATVTVAPERQ
jgi:membrane fusion protein (multidrug efflux system)